MNMGCQRRIGDAWSRGVCGKTPVETVGTEELCKRHASAAKGAATAKARRYAEHNMQQAIEDSWKARADDAASTLGITVRLHFSPVSHRRSEDVVISLADLERLAARHSE